MPLRISRVLHAGYIFEHQSVRIIFDPIFENPFSQNCFSFPAVRFDLKKISEEKFSAVFISHYHDDHFSLESLNYIHRKTPIYLYCIHEELFTLLRQLGFENVYSLELGNPIQIGTFKIKPLLALDADVDCIFHIQVEELNILHVVDAWIDPLTMHRLIFVKKWDLVLWPFQTMRELEVLSLTVGVPSDRKLPPEWIEQLKQLQPRYVVPSSCQFQFESWSWYNRAFFPISYRQFEEELQECLPHTKAIVLNPGKSILLDQSQLRVAEKISWIQPLGPQNVDYIYDPDSPAQTTAEIAGHLPFATNEQESRCVKFCQLELVEKFNKLEFEQKESFIAPCCWQLKLWRKDGTSMHFNYLIQNGQIQTLEDQPDLVSWYTEFPMIKLWSALEEGEAMTSLYLRIKTEPTTDILQDPLILALYTNSIGSYQTAQLERINKRFRTN